MCLVTVYYVVSYWYYPLKNILGDTGCHIANILRETGTLQIQLHSFIMATTRYIFLFHENLLLRFNLTTNVSAILFHIFDFNPIWTGIFDFCVFDEKVRKSGRFSKIFIFGPTKMCNTSKKSSEKSSFNSEIIFGVFLLKKNEKITFSFFRY